jgi:hypothetical protein
LSEELDKTIGEMRERGMSLEQVGFDKTEIDEVVAAMRQWEIALEQRGLLNFFGGELAKGISSALADINSDDRAEEMLRLTWFVDSDVFWKVFHENWCCCDDTWYLRKVLIDALSCNHAEGSACWLMDTKQRRFFDKLPPTVTVYRGCSSDRIRGISWTTDLSVAERFARGHRGIKVPDPVVVKAQIPKDAIFTVFVERNESEIVLDPEQLKLHLH